MATSSESFDANIQAWKAAQEAPWFRLRYRLADANLKRHLPDLTLRVLDIGGGNGRDSLPLAQQGHAVTIADYSAQMLADARSTAAEQGIADNVTLLQTDLAALPDHFPEPAFDLVLCHNVLQYVDDAADSLRIISSVVAQHGLLSVISPNPYAEALRAAFQQGDLSAARSQLYTTTAFAATFGVTVQRYTIEQLHQWITIAGCKVVGTYGIRCVGDYLPDNSRKSDPTFFADLERLEYAMSDTYPYYLIARLLHLIAQKDVVDPGSEGR